MKTEQGVMAHTFNPHSQEAEADEFEDSLVYIANSKSPKIHNETLSQEPKGNEKKKKEERKGRR